MLTPVQIGISSCFLGNKVRYDGGHSHDRFLTQTLGLFIDYIPVCPEVECGMSTPREAGRLNDPQLRELFIENIFSFQRWRDLLNQNKTLGGLVDFHTRNKYLILSHSHDHYRKLGKLVAHGNYRLINCLTDMKPFF